MSDAAADYDSNPLWRLVGARINALGANDAGEIFISTDRGDEFVIGLDPNGEISLFQILKEQASG